MYKLALRRLKQFAPSNNVNAFNQKNQNPKFGIFGE